MTVRAHELALGDLVQHARATAAPSEDSEVCCLRAAGEVVPLHRRRVKRASAVGAWPPGLEPDVPLDERRMSAPVLRLSSCLVRLVMGRGILAFARRAPRLMAVRSAMKVDQRSLLPATTAMLCPRDCHDAIGNICSHNRRTVWARRIDAACLPARAVTPLPSGTRGGRARGCWSDGERARGAASGRWRSRARRARRAQ